MVQSVISFLRSFLLSGPLMSTMRSLQAYRLFCWVQSLIRQLDSAIQVWYAYLSCTFWRSSTSFSASSLPSSSSSNASLTCNQRKVFHSAHSFPLHIFDWVDYMSASRFRLDKCSYYNNDLLGEEQAGHHNCILDTIVKNPFYPRLLIVNRYRALKLVAQGRPHCANQCLQPHLHSQFKNNYREAKKFNNLTIMFCWKLTSTGPSHVHWLEKGTYSPSWIEKLHVQGVLMKHGDALLAAHVMYSIWRHMVSKCRNLPLSTCRLPFLKGSPRHPFQILGCGCYQSTLVDVCKPRQILL